MGYRPKTTDELLGKGESTFLGTALGAFQQYQSIMNGLEERRYMKEARVQKKRDYQLGVVDDIGKKLESAVAKGDRELQLQYSNQLKDLGSKIVDDGNELTRASYKAHATFADDVQADVKLLDDFDNYMEDAQKRGGRGSYDYYANAKDADDFQERVEKSKEKINEWRRTLSDSGINEKLYSDALTTQEATINKLSSLGGFNRDLPKGLKSFERQFFNNSLTGQGTMTTEDAYNFYSTKQKSNEAQIVGLEAQYREQESALEVLNQDTDYSKTEEQVNFEREGIQEMLMNLDTKLIPLRERRDQLSEILDDERTADWAGIGLGMGDTGENWEENDATQQHFIDEVLALDPNVKTENGKIVDKDGKELSFDQVKDLHSNLEAENNEKVKAENIIKDKEHKIASEKELGADVYAIASKNNIPAFNANPGIQKYHRQWVQQFAKLDTRLEEANKKLEQAEVSLSKIESNEGKIKDTREDKDLTRKEKKEIILGLKKDSERIKNEEGFPYKYRTRGFDDKIGYKLDEKTIERQLKIIDQLSIKRTEVLKKIKPDTPN